MEKTETLTISVSRRTKERLQQLAQEMHTREEDIAVDALEDILNLEDREEAIIRRRLEEADRPDARFVPHEEVVTWMKSLGTKNPLPQPEGKLRSDL